MSNVRNSLQEHRPSLVCPFTVEGKKARPWHQQGQPFLGAGVKKVKIPILTSWSSKNVQFACCFHTPWKLSNIWQAGLCNHGDVDLPGILLGRTPNTRQTPDTSIYFRPQEGHGLFLPLLFCSCFLPPPAWIPSFISQFPTGVKMLLPSGRAHRWPRQDIMSTCVILEEGRVLGTTGSWWQDFQKITQYLGSRWAHGRRGDHWKVSGKILLPLWWSPIWSVSDVGRKSPAAVCFPLGDLKNENDILIC